MGDEPGIDELAERLALAGYERVDRVEERGHFALRGGIVDVYPTTGREPLRIELFGDEIEGIRAFSAFTQRTLHPVESATIRPAAERRLDLTETTLPDENEAPTVPDDLVPAIPGGPDLVWRADEVREVWADEFPGEDQPSLERAAAARPAAAGSAARLRSAAAGDRGPRPVGGRERAARLRARRPPRRRRVPTSW